MYLSLVNSVVGKTMIVMPIKLENLKLELKNIKNKYIKKSNKKDKKKIIK